MVHQRKKQRIDNGKLPKQLKKLFSVEIFRKLIRGWVDGRDHLHQHRVHGFHRAGRERFRIATQCHHRPWLWVTIFDGSQITCERLERLETDWKQIGKRLETLNK